MPGTQSQGRAAWLQPLGTTKNKKGHHPNTPPLRETSRAQYSQAKRYSWAMENMTVEELLAAYVAGERINRQINDGDEERILVFDLGSSTCDVSILDCSHDQEYPVGIVKATDRDKFLGESNFDNVIVQMALKKFAKMNPDADVNAIQRQNEHRLRQEAIKVKASLSTNLKAIFNIPVFTGTQDLTFEITRTQFERSSIDLFDKLVDRCKGVLLLCEDVLPVYFDDGRLHPEETLRENPPNRARGLDSIIDEAKASINRVIMVGSASRMPKLKAVLETFFDETAETPASSKRVISLLKPD
jgi:molecular chaperone DnaK (HSP70)